MSRNGQGSGETAVLVDDLVVSFGELRAIL